MSVIIEFATDFVCPYCIAAQVPLKKAIAGREDVSIRLLPLELTPQGKERVDTYHDPVRKEKWGKNLIPFVQRIGLDAHFPPKVIPRPYTTLAWEGWHYACSEGKGDAYAERMYEAYFVEEQDIGEIPVLCELAREIGLDPASFEKALNDGIYRDAQSAAVRETRSRGVTHVPTIWINGVELLNPLLTEEEYRQVLSDSAEDSENEERPFGGCGPDGC